MLIIYVKGSISLGLPIVFLGKIWTIIITMEYLQKFSLFSMQLINCISDRIIHRGFLTLMIVVVYLKFSNSSLPFLSHHTLKIEGLHLLIILVL